MYFAAANTGRADPHALTRAFHQRVHGLEIEIPTPLRDIVGVTDSMSELRPAAADFTYFCHGYTRGLSGAEPTEFSLSGAGDELQWQAKTLPVE